MDSKIVLNIDGAQFEGTVSRVESQNTSSGMGSQTVGMNQCSNSMSYYGNGVQSSSPAGAPSTAKYPNTVTAVRKNQEGNIVLFKLDDGRILDYSGCADAIHRGELNLICTTGKSGALSIRSQADGDPTNNLDALPTF